MRTGVQLGGPSPGARARSWLLPGDTASLQMRTSMTSPATVTDDHVHSWTVTVREHARALPADVLDAYLARVPANYVHDCPPLLAARDLVALDRLELGGMSVSIDPG